MNRNKTILIVVLVIIILVGIFWGALYLRRFRFSLEKEAVKHSLQYTESKQAMLMQLVGDWYKAEDKGQKNYLMNRIKLESSKLEWRDVPEDVKTILRRVE